MISNQKWFIAVPVATTILMITALTLMFVVNVDYGNFFFQSSVEKDAYLVFSMTSSFAKKAALTVLASMLLLLNKYASTYHINIEYQKDWLQLGSVFAMVVLFFVFVSPSEFSVPSHSAGYTENGRVADLIISCTLQNRFILTSPTSILLAVSLSLVAHCIGRCLRTPGILCVCSAVFCLTGIYCLISSFDFFVHDYLSNGFSDNSVFPLSIYSVLSLCIALVMICIGSISGNAKALQTFPTIQHIGKKWMLFLGICIGVVFSPSLVRYIVMYLGKDPYAHSTVDKFDVIQRMLIFAGILATLSLCVKHKTIQYCKFIPLFVLIYLSTIFVDITMYIHCDLFPSEIAVKEIGKTGAYLQMYYISCGCISCIPMLFYSMYMLYDYGGRNNLISYAAITVCISVLVCLPPFYLPIGYKTIATATRHYIASNVLVNLGISLLTPALFILIGVRNTDIAENN